MSRSAFWLLWGRVVFVEQGGFYGFGEFMGLVSFMGLGCAGLLVMAASSTRTRYAIVVSGRFIPYRRRAFPVPNISPVPEKPVFAHRVLLKTHRVHQKGVFVHRISFLYRKSLFFVPSSSETASRTQVAVFSTECIFRTQRPLSCTEC